MTEEWKEKKLVLYGLGTETERVLKEWNGSYHVIGLLDSFRTEGELFGYPIMDIRRLAGQKDIVIVVVARPGSCRAIAKGIRGFCKQNGILLFDIRGNDLLVDKKAVYSFKAVRGYKRVDLLRLVKKMRAVSFDLFDTLIVRNVSSQVDVIDILDERLKEKGIFISDFSIKRIKAEKYLSQIHAPSLERIYEEILKKEGKLGISAKELSQMEYELDCSLQRPRKETVEVLNEIVKFGKDIYITSESYYHKEQIEKILINNGITHIKNIFVSCEYDEGKNCGLYKRLIQGAGTENILHIGDDVVADVEMAERNGIHAFCLYSPMELLEMLGGLEVTEMVKNLSDRIRIGMFATEIFNSPFQFERGEQKVQIKTAFEVGYLFCAPMILDFMYWFGKQTEKYQVGNVWFCARDGYLLQKLYGKLYPERKTQYFLTSRTAAIRAGVREKKDIDYVDSMKFSGNTEENLLARFGMDARDISDVDIDSNGSGLLKYVKPILETAKVKRKNNQKYIETLPKQEGMIALFDFVAKGTGQMFIQKFVSDEIVGLYFLQLEPEFMKDKGLWIQSFYTKEEKDASEIFDNYYILETILTSPDPSVDEFDEEGKPVYDIETRKLETIKCIMQAQDGISNYVDMYLKICPRGEIKVNKKLDEAFLKLIHKIEIRDQNFWELIVEDPFFNRMTAVADIL